MQTHRQVSDIVADTAQRERSGRRTAPLDPLVSETLKTLARAVRSVPAVSAEQSDAWRAQSNRRVPRSIRCGRRWIMLELGITETEFTHDDVTVYAETDRGGREPPVAVLQGRHKVSRVPEGIRGVASFPSFLRRCRPCERRLGGDEDLVTLFWECDFEHLAYTFEEAGGDGYAAPGAELLKGGAATGAVPRRPTVRATRERTDAAHRSSRKISDFDSTLYFLEEQEISYLHQSVREDFTGRSARVGRGGAAGYLRDAERSDGARRDLRRSWKISCSCSCRGCSFVPPHSSFASARRLLHAQKECCRRTSGGCGTRRIA